jgi:hypothetical protein
VTGNPSKRNSDAALIDREGGGRSATEANREAREEQTRRVRETGGGRERRKGRGRKEGEGRK